MIVLESILTSQSFCSGKWREMNLLHAYKLKKMQNQVRNLSCNKQFKIKFFHSILLQRHATGGSDVEQRWRQRSVSLVQVSSSHPLTPTIFASSFAQAKRFVFMGIVGARKKEVQSIMIPRLSKPLHYTVNIRMSASVCVQLIFVGKLNARLILF